MNLFAKSRAILQSLRGATSQAQMQRVPMLVEEFEPRILHSADIGPALLHDGAAAPQVETRVLDAGGEYSADASQTQQAHTELVIVDSRTPDYQQLVDDIRSEAAGGRQIEVVLLDNRANGIDQITEMLSGRKDIGAIHIISHGSEGEVQLGGSVLDLQSLRSHAAEIESWAIALTTDADLLIYGCNVAGSPDGRTLVDALSRLTGADVAASENLTGSFTAGGDWNLEYATGKIQTAVAIDAQTEQSWTGTLAISQDAVSSATTAATASTTLSFAHTIGTGADGILLVELAIKANGGATSITYGGNALTKLATVSSGGNVVTSELWYLKAPAAGTANIVITLPAVARFDAGGTSYFGIDQSTPLGNVVTATGSGGTPSVTVASASGELVVDATAVHAASTSAIGPGQTESWSLNSGTAGGDVWGGSSTEPGAASVTMSWTTSGSGAGEWASIAAALRPSSVNSAPALSGANNLGAINEDSATNPGTSVSALIAGHVTDPDPGALSGIAVTAVDNTNGNWQYSIDAGGAWSNLGSPSDTSARLLRSTDFVRFVPNADFNGTVNNGLTFRAWDQTSGTAGATANTLSTASTVLDTFSSNSYTNNDGTAAWSAGWVDTDGSPSGGNVQIAGNQLEFTVVLGGGTIYREADLSGATGATLTLSYNNQVLLGLGANVQLQISNNGGGSYTTLHTFSQTNTGTGTLSFDIGAYIAPNTRIQFVAGGIAIPQVLDIDNVQIAYITPLASGVTAFSSATASSSITVTPVNDPPTGTDNTVTIAEDGTYTFSAADFGFGDPDTPANPFVAVTITTLPGAGSLELNGSALSAGQSVSVGLLSAGKLQYIPASDGNGVAYATFTFQVQDGGGGPNLDPTARTMTIDVTAVNDPPTGTNNTVTAAEDGSHVFSTADFGFSDSADAPANALLSVKIATLPGAGSLTLNGIAVTAGQFIAAADIAGGDLVFTPAAGVSGAGYASFTFQVQDDGGGVDLDPVARTMTIDVAVVNDPPTGTNSTISTAEDSAYTFVVGDFGFSDPSDAPANNLFAVQIATLPGAGSLTLSGGAVAAGQFVSQTDIAAGNLQFTPASQASGTGYASFTFRVQDDGGGANLDVTARTMTIDVTALNDPPAGTSTTVTAAEDASHVFTAAEFGFTDPADTPGNNLFAVKITTLPGTGSLTLNGTAVTAGQFVLASDITAGNLVFTPAADGNGVGYASFTFQVQDDGGTANLDLIARAMTVDVTAIDDTPVNSVPGSQATNQDTSLVFSTAGGNAISISDVDAAASAVKLILSASNGTMTLATTLGLTFATGTGSGDATMQFSGSTAAINAALDGLIFSPNSGFAGTAGLSIVTDDQGNTGSGGPLTASNVVNINVAATPAPPITTPVVPIIDPLPIPVPLPPVTVGDPVLPLAPTPVPTAGPETPTFQEIPSAGGTVAPDAAALPFDLAAESGRSVSYTLSAPSTRNAHLVGISYTLPAAQWLMFGDDPAAGLADGSAASFGFGGVSDGRSGLQSPALIDALDRLREGLQEQSRAEALIVATTAAASLGLSVGYVLWLLRGGVLISTMLSSLPAWRLVDPLPILGRLDDEDEDTDDDSIETLVAARNAEPVAQPVIPAEPATPKSPIG